jgi:hypothetical protein
MMTVKLTYSKCYFSTIGFLFVAKGRHKGRLGIEGRSNGQSRIQTPKECGGQKEFPERGM